MTAKALHDIMCTCHPQPLGLPFILTAGCLVHDHCVCPRQAERVEVAEGVQVARSADDLGCLWCDSFTSFLKALASLDELALARVKRAYREGR